MEAVGHLIGYDAFVVGSAVYAAHWQKEASAFVRRNRAVLASRPVWLFSRSPLGTEAADAKGRDLTVAAELKEIAEFEGAIGPKGHRVFFGALDPGTLGFSRTGDQDAASRPHDAPRGRLPRLGRDRRLGERHRPPAGAVNRKRHSRHRAPPVRSKKDTMCRRASFAEGAW